MRPNRIPVSPWFTQLSRKACEQINHLTNPFGRKIGEVPALFASIKSWLLLLSTHVAAEPQRWGGLLLTRLVPSGSSCNASVLEILDDLYKLIEFDVLVLSCPLSRPITLFGRNRRPLAPSPLPGTQNLLQVRQPRARVVFP